MYLMGRQCRFSYNLKNSFDLVIFSDENIQTNKIGEKKRSCKNLFFYRRQGC